MRVLVSAFNKGETVKTSRRLFDSSDRDTGELFITCDYKRQLATKFRSSKTKSSEQCSEPRHRKSGKSQGKVRCERL